MPGIGRADARYPDRTIRLVVPFPAGGATDIVGRMFADKLTHQLGQTVIVDNKSGAAGSIGVTEVKNAKPDGYTLLVATSSTHAINPTAFVHPPYDPISDFTPVSSVCVNPLVFFSNPSLPPTMIELVQLMKKIPASIPRARPAWAASSTSPSNTSNGRSAAWTSYTCLTRAVRRASRMSSPATSHGR